MPPKEIPTDDSFSEGHLKKEWAPRVIRAGNPENYSTLPFSDWTGWSWGKCWGERAPAHVTKA